MIFIRSLFVLLKTLKTLSTISPLHLRQTKGKARAKVSEWGRLEGRRIDERNFLLFFFTSSIELLVRIWWIWRGYRKSLMNATEMFRSLAYALVSKLTLSFTWLVRFLVLKVLLMKEAFSRSISLCLVIFFSPPTPERALFCICFCGIIS